MRFWLHIVIFHLILGHAFAQQTSTIREEKSKHDALGIHSDEEWDQINNKQANTISKLALPNNNCVLNKRVYGWHPYWMGSVYTNYQWNLLSDFCYFDYTINENTGNNSNGSFAWSTSAAVTAAKNNGCKIHFCATLFSNHATFWNSPSAQTTFINNVITLLNNRGANGVNIDFEGMGASDKIPFNNFMQNLCNAVHAANPNYEVSMALYAVDWSGTFDIPTLKNFVDAFIIMGYDYYYSGSSTAGPGDPLYNFQTSYNQTLSKSITYYLSQGVPNNKLLLGLPYYGREWSTNSNAVPSTTTGAFSSSRTYTYVKQNAATYNSTNYYWDQNSFSPAYIYQTGGQWRQCWINSPYSLRKRFDMVNQRQLGGIGIWALGYDDGYPDYWDAIADKFSSCTIVPCKDTLYDMGGPNRNYYDKENYWYTISPTGSNKISLSFTQFDLETNFDSLWLYDGANPNASLIGSYTGTNGPGTVVSTTNALCLRFKSDNSTTRTGFRAVWNCIMDTISPTTSVQFSSLPVSGFQTGNFTANFIDMDNAGGSGIEKRFYQVQFLNNNLFEANNTRGFLHDDFNSAVVHPQWTIKSGNWSPYITSQLQQSDQSNSNTNIYAALTQNLSNRYVYQFRMQISGSGTNRRAGLHIFCNQPDSSNRGTNYLIWFRVDQNTIELYRNTNNVLNLVKTSAATINASQWYDITISYDRILGQLKVWMDGKLKAFYTDANPISNGNYVSFRSGNCDLKIDYFSVFRSRNATSTILVGAAGNNDILTQNPNPVTPSGKIRSLVVDSANNLSAIASLSVNTDWTLPLNCDSAWDGLTPDIDTSYSNTILQNGWNNASDQHSGIQAYWYSIGTSPGDSSIVNWTNNNLNKQVNLTGQNLPFNQLLFCNVRTVNGAGLTSTIQSSDGWIILNPNAIHENEIYARIYPNPVISNLIIELNHPEFYSGTITLSDAKGCEVYYGNLVSGKNILSIQQQQLPPGTYLLRLTGKNKIITKTLIVQ